MGCFWSKSMGGNRECSQWVGFSGWKPRVGTAVSICHDTGERIQWSTPLPAWKIKRCHLPRISVLSRLWPCTPTGNFWSACWVATIAGRPLATPCTNSAKGGKETLRSRSGSLNKFWPIALPLILCRAHAGHQGQSRLNKDGGRIRLAENRRYLSGLSKCCVYRKKLEH
jgi:hypothetical protein